MKEQPFKINQHVFVHRPEGAFSGVVKGIRDGWLRIAGQGSIHGTIYDEWFPIEAKSIFVTPA